MLTFIESLIKIRNVLLRMIEVGAAIVALLVLLYLFLGEGSGSFINDVISNLGYLIEEITPQALIAIAIVISSLLIIKSKR
ncbi:MAG: hypothetical protein OSB67_09585 [Alphaproteobacteria bacterium]|jgi:hypothetical protein|nr:hypothetical protein [Alphaproteobacteria bacterium]